MQTKLIMVDCDGVIYEPHELDINAMVYAFNEVCDDLGLIADKVNRIENSTHDKPVKGFFNYIRFLAQRENIAFETFVSFLVKKVDYSAIKPDTKNTLHALCRLNEKVPVCIFTNNHALHLNQVLKAKFGVEINELPFPCFDVVFSFDETRFTNKESAFSVRRLEKRFGCQATQFLWIDDSESILNATAQYGCRGLLITKDFLLPDALCRLNKTF